MRLQHIQTMAHPQVENPTPLIFEPLLLLDEEGAPLLVPTLKATFDIQPDGKLALAEEQAPLWLEGKYEGEPGESSMRYEPEGVRPKLATDIALVGHAHATEGVTTELVVALQVGPVKKGLRIIGDRKWVRTMGRVQASAPRPFDVMPLVYERAFGGRDTTGDPDPVPLEPRNPVGVGFRAKGSHFEEGLALPNLEDPAEPLRQFGQVVAPAGLGFIAPHWQPRASLAGTYDEAWQEERAPLLPLDFDCRFLNAASPGLVAPGFLRGDEAVTGVNVAPGGRLQFRLPGLGNPAAVLVRPSGDIRLPLQLDTVLIDTDAMQLYLVWRGERALSDGPHQVGTVALEVELPSAFRLPAA